MFIILFVPPCHHSSFCCLLFKLCFDGRVINLIVSFSGVEDQQGVNLQQSPAIQHAIAAAVTVL